jgi:hypothetical protein
MPLKIVQVVAVILTALALVPCGAHAFALLNKIELAAGPYFVVQSIYRGWALFGIVVIGALLADLALALMLRRRSGAPFVLALLGFCGVALTLVIFFVWTYPANQATGNWTMIVDNWEQLRWRWEYSHAINGVITFLALCSITSSVVITQE